MDPQVVDVDELIEAMDPMEFRGWVAMGNAIRNTIRSGATYVAIPGRLARGLSPAYPLEDVAPTTAGVAAATVAGMELTEALDPCGLDGFLADEELGVHWWCLRPAAHDGRHGWELPRLAALDARAAGYELGLGGGAHELHSLKAQVRLDLDALAR